MVNMLVMIFKVSLHLSQLLFRWWLSVDRYTI